MEIEAGFGSGAKVEIKILKYDIVFMINTA
jgi:hypothetical protein